MKNILFLLALLLSTQYANANELKDKSEAKTAAESAMHMIAAGKTQEALDQLKTYWPLPASEVDQLVLQIKNGMSVVGDRFGKPVGVELISAKSAGESFYQVQYIQKFSRHALVWNFLFYKPEKTWIINTVNFSDKTDYLSWAP